MKGAVYNEIDPFCVEWLKRLILADLIAPGDVDSRSIEDVHPDDWRGYGQVHAFAGIGVWSYALRCAGWPDDRPVWTGSCPCQPFSEAGQGRGFADERHLWPAWHWLIEQHRPDVVLGEQVASRPGLAWLDLVSNDMEAAGYTFGAADLGAAGVGAPHIRQRLWWVGVAPGGGRERSRGQPAHLVNRQADAVGLGLADDDEAGQRQQRGGGLLNGKRPASGYTSMCAMKR